MRLWARSDRSAAAAAEQFPDVTTDAAQAASGASLCVFCTPIGAMPELAASIAGVLSPDCVITDAGSVKGPVVAQLEGTLGGRFVGSHPMAGSERSGLAAARADLFEGAAAIVTPTPKSDPAAVAAVRELWASVGCRITEMAPDAHDESVALVSHLPHAAAAVMVNAINDRLPDATALAGGGYRDSTRIAAGPSAMWCEILLENKAALIAGLAEYTRTLEDLKTMILSEDAPALEAFLARAKAVRDTLP